VSVTDFFTAETRVSVREAVQTIEAGSGAEIVVSVVRRAGSYPEALLASGAIAGFAVLVVVLFAEAEFPVWAMPIDVAMGALIGAAIAWKSATVRRALASTKRAADATELAALRQFVERGITKTRDRTGVLVLIAADERRVAVIADHGIDTTAIADAWMAWKAKVAETVEQRSPDASAFVAALLELAPLVARVAPKRDDDVNELPDEPEVL
jgi:putative membrane protein